MKVLQVASVDVTAKRLMVPLVDRLIENGHSVDIACSYGEYTDALRSAGYNILTVPFSRNIFTLGHFRALKDMYKLVKSSNYDVIHFHTAMSSLVGRLGAKIAGRPLTIYTAHGFYFHENMNALLRVSSILVEKALARLATDWIFTVSKEDADIAKRHRFLRKEDRIVYIGNGIDIEMFSNRRETPGLRSSLGIKGSDKVVGFIGRLVEEKGILDLAKAFLLVKEKLPETKLVFVGDLLESDRDKAAKEKLQKIVEECELGDCVVFTGFRDDVPELLSLMDLFVLPSYREGLPITVLEAMASEKPVVATNIRGCREIVEDGKTGFLVPVGDYCFLADAIIRILSDKSLAANMGSLGRTRIVDNYNEKNIYDLQIKIYKEIEDILKQKRGGEHRIEA